MKRHSSSRLMNKVFLSCLLVLFSSLGVSPFTLLRPSNSKCSAVPFLPGTRVFSTSNDSSDPTNLMEPMDMKLRDMKEELKGMGVSFSDCFDRESLTRRLVDAREKAKRGDRQQPKSASSVSTTNEKIEQETPKAPSDQPSSPDSSSNFDREGTLAELRSLRVKELRTECAERNIRWANMIEKEDLVNALLDARQNAAEFSPSGALAPGQVADINDNQLTAELKAGGAKTPLLLDVYATWCGPCHVMGPQLVEASKELGSAVRVAKIDSDKYPTWASKLQVGGLPTVILFDSTGKELQRVEGALMKDGLIQLARSHM